MTEGFRPHVPKPSLGGRWSRRDRMRGTPKGWEPLRQNEHSLPPLRGKVPPQGADEGGYRWVRRPTNGRMGTSAPTPGYDKFRRGRCPQRPIDNGCTPVVPLIRHGLRPCHLLPCGAKALAVLTSLRQTLWRSPHPSRLAPCHLPPGEGFLFLTPGAGAGADMIRPESYPKSGIPQSASLTAPFNKGAKGRGLRIATSARWVSLQ